MSKLNLKANPDNPVEVAILEYLEANVSDSLTERINAGKKTIGGCYRFIEQQALDKIEKDKRHGNVCVPMPRNEVFGQAIHYFEEDSLDFEKKAPAASVVASSSPSPSSAPVKAKGAAKVSVVEPPKKKADVGFSVDSLLSDMGISLGDGATAMPPAEKKAKDEEKKKIEEQWLPFFQKLGIGV